jgi:hypothetical protein
MSIPSEPLTLKLIGDAGVAVLGLFSGGFKKIAPPELPKAWVTMATLAACVSFFTVKPILQIKGTSVTRNQLLIAAILAACASVFNAIAYLLSRSARTVAHPPDSKRPEDLRLVGTETEYLPSVVQEPDNRNKSLKTLMFDAGGDATDLWPPQH